MLYPRSCPSSKHKFIQKLVDNINDRFNGTDIVTTFGVLSMRPLSFLSSEDLDDWGNGQIEKLTAHYSGKMEVRKGQQPPPPPPIDPEATKEE